MRVCIGKRLADQLYRGARGFCTEPVADMTRVWEAIGRKADAQWVATGIATVFTTGFGLIGTGLYYTSERRFEQFVDKIDVFKSEMVEKFEALSENIDDKIKNLNDKMDDKIHNLNDKMDDKIQNLNDKMHHTIQNLSHKIQNLNDKMDDATQGLNDKMDVNMGAVHAKMDNLTHIVLHGRHGCEST